MIILPTSVELERLGLPGGEAYEGLSPARGLSRSRGFAYVLVRRPSRDRRRGHPTHTFVLPPRRDCRGWELAYRETLPTDEYFRLSPALATPIVLTSCDLPGGQAHLGHGPTSKPNPWDTTSSPTPRGMNDDQASSIYR